MAQKASGESLIYPQTLHSVKYFENVRHCAIMHRISNL